MQCSRSGLRPISNAPRVGIQFCFVPRSKPRQSHGQPKRRFEKKKRLSNCRPSSGHLFLALLRDWAYFRRSAHAALSGIVLALWGGYTGCSKWIAKEREVAVLQRRCALQWVRAWSIGSVQGNRFVRIRESVVFREAVALCCSDTPAFFAPRSVVRSGELIRRYLGLGVAATSGIVWTRIRPLLSRYPPAVLFLSGRVSLAWVKSSREEFARRGTQFMASLCSYFAFISVREW